MSINNDSGLKTFGKRCVTTVKFRDNLQRWLEGIWYQGKWGSALLQPVSLLYCLLNRLDRWYQSRQQQHIGLPVIVVGNMTVGGTGKTPLTIFLARQLEQIGFKPAIITRGYGGKSRDWPQRVSASSDPAEWGDEAVLLAIRTGLPVYAGPDRLASIRLATKEHPDCNLVIADDGLQHYRLPRDVQIAVVDAERGFGNGYCLPAGPLREPLYRIAACDYIVVNQERSSAGSAQHEKRMPGGLPSGIASRVISMQLAGEKLVNLEDDRQLPLAALSGQQVHAVAGIGHPERFFRVLARSGLQPITHPFPDHHAFRPQDLDFGDDLPVVMTEKDAVKCRRFAMQNCWYLPVEATLEVSVLTSMTDRLNQLNPS